MTSLTPKQVRHIAKLARLSLKPEEEQKYAKELSSILDYVDMLQEVDTSAVKTSSQVTGLENSFREDVVKTDNPTTEELLSTSALPIVDNQIQTPSAHG